MSQYKKQRPTDFENLKTGFMIAVISGNEQAAMHIGTGLLEWLTTSEYLKENSHKAVNQLITFTTSYLKNRDWPQLSTVKQQIKKRMAEIVRNETRSVKHIDASQWLRENEITDAHLSIALKTLIIFQLTSGCSNRCRRCNEWALPGVRKHFTFETVKQLSHQLFHINNSSFIFYGASDPIDWQDNNCDLSHLLSFLQRSNYAPEYGFLTKLPVGKKAVLEKLLANNADIAISVTAKNRDRIYGIEIEQNCVLNKQHDVDELMIPTGLDEDFKTIKSSITDSYGTEITPDGIHIIVPTFTSIINLTGQYRIPVDKNTSFYLEKKTGRQALAIDYFKPLDAVDLHGNRLKLEILLDAQIETILLDTENETISPPGMMDLKTFFETFDFDAVISRKKIIPSVVKTYKKDILQGKRYKSAPLAIKKRYRLHVKHYLTLSNPSKMKVLKRYVISFFLKAIHGYVLNNSDKCILIKHLLKSEKEMLYDKYSGDISEKRFKSLVNNSDIDSFDAFRLMVNRLLDTPDNCSIHEFIDMYPAHYDSELDMFLPQTDSPVD